MSPESDAKYVSEIVKKMMDRALGQTKDEPKENIDPLNDVVHNLKSMFEKPAEESKAKEEPKEEQETKENPALNILGNILKELVNQTMDQMDKLDQEEREENRQFFPRFTALYDSWSFSEVSELPTKPVPVWDHVDDLEVYLYASINEDKSEVSSFFLSHVCKDLKNGEYVSKVCAIVKKIFNCEFLGVQHHFALHVVNHLQNALKPNLDNAA
jgi:hypothetical protein